MINSAHSEGGTNAKSKPSYKAMGVCCLPCSCYNILTCKFRQKSIREHFVYQGKCQKWEIILKNIDLKSLTDFEEKLSEDQC